MTLACLLRATEAKLVPTLGFMGTKVRATQLATLDTGAICND
jgi:hypothetical protein